VHNVGDGNALPPGAVVGGRAFLLTAMTSSLSIARTSPSAGGAVVADGRHDRIVAAYLDRATTEPGGYDVVAVEFDRTHLVYLDAALDDICRDDPRIPHRTADCARLRSAVVEAVMRAFVSGGDSVGGDADPTASSAMTEELSSILLGALVQRFEPVLDQRLVPLDLFLPPDLMDRLDQTLHRFARTHLHPKDQTSYLGGEYEDLRAACIEGVVLNWMIDDDLVARQAVPAWAAKAMWDAHLRSWHRRRWRWTA
jgi:hypothetical protein